MKNLASLTIFDTIQWWSC